MKRMAGRSAHPIQLAYVEANTGHTREVKLERAATRVLPAHLAQQLPGTARGPCADRQFQRGCGRKLGKIVSDIERQQIKAIILDLRNNPGGILDEAVGMAAVSSDKGNVLLERDAVWRGQAGAGEKERGGDPAPVGRLDQPRFRQFGGNPGGRLQDGHRATLVGEKTFATAPS